MFPDEVVSSNGGRTRDSSHAVHKHISLLKVTINELICLTEMLRDWLICDVLDVDVELFYSLWEGKRVTAH